MTNITTRVLVRVGREPARQAPELRLVSECIPGPTVRAGERGVGWVTEPNRHPCHSSQQQNALREESRTPLFPPRQTVRILKRNTSTRLLSTAHKGSGFFGLRLSLRGHFVGPITPLLLIQSATVALAVQDRTQIVTAVAVTTSNSSAYAYIDADPVGRVLLFWQGDFYTDPTIPLAILPEEFPLLAERRAWQGQGPIDGAMLRSWDVQFADPLHHNPQVKAGGVPWSLNVGGINQLSSQCGSLERLPGFASRFETPAIVSKCATGSASVKLASAPTRGDTGPFHVHNRLCGNRVQTAEQPRQEREGITLGARRKTLQLIREYSLGCHESSITQGQEKRKTPTVQSLRSRPAMGGERSLRLQTARASNACRVRPAVLDRHAGLALLAPYARASAPQRHSPSNVKLIDEADAVRSSFCIHHPERLPTGDLMLHQKLLLETSEEEFLKIANRTEVGSVAA
jgi:hypothetical protein